MILDVMVICSLIFAAPYYDCSTEWVIVMTDSDIWCDDEFVWGCSTTYTGEDVNTPDMIQLNMNELDRKDQQGRSLLEHELLHLKCPECELHVNPE